ncbi:MAG: hypothetical protein JSV51_05650 [Candidatus Bathyarchaeota archaeon]|nr:MAG: hypothetical protein JSV51_05650 [Candidatus Bathyarchaeota archaeon]
MGSDYCKKLLRWAAELIPYAEFVGNVASVLPKKLLDLQVMFLIVKYASLQRVRRKMRARKSDDYTVKVAQSKKEIVELLEAGFEWVGKTAMT